jgi:hypothetical protein
MDLGSSKDAPVAAAVAPLQPVRISRYRNDSVFAAPAVRGKRGLPECGHSFRGWLAGLRGEGAPRSSVSSQEKASNADRIASWRLGDLWTKERISARMTRFAAQSYRLRGGTRGTRIIFPVA